MIEIETSEEIDGGFTFARVQSELRKLPNDADGYLVLYCPTQGSLRVERHNDTFSIERRREPNKVHYELGNANEGCGLSIAKAEAVCRAFFNASSP